MFHKCYGQCFEQCSEHEYKKIEGSTCPCVLEPCLNIRYCSVKAPEWYLNCHAGKCLDCDINFGEWCHGSKSLEFREEIMECPICLDNKDLSVKFPFCTHYICLDCFRECFSWIVLERPPFPYGKDVEEAYYTIPSWDRELFIRRYPLITEWRDSDELVEEEECMLNEDRRNLHKCSLCRAEARY